MLRSRLIGLSLVITAGFTVRIGLSQSDERSRPASPATASTAPTSAPTSAPAEPAYSADTFAGLSFRSLGPALTSGRVVDFAVDPANRAHYFVAVASGGVWKTTNAGTTFEPVFDTQGSYSIGCVTLDPHNPNIVWVGTGENNSQRSVGFGDGVYRSRDGGKNWEDLGLHDTEHIGRIVVDPRDSDTVYVAAQGPLWRNGPERGLYKTTNGGQTWQPILQISPRTGVNEVHLDPRNPDVVYATAYERQRKVWTLINGGPESAIYKSTDAGRTWRKLTRGLPDVELGRIGLTISPVKPDVVYAIVEAADGQSGFYRSLDCGETWEKRSDFTTTSPQYYNELFADPVLVDRVYAVNTFFSVTEDGGKTFQRVNIEHMHVDHHAVWIDPRDNDYLLVGCDGGIYETFDHAANWRFMPNLPVTQFYRVCADNSEPFYYVYGGTQDNSSVGAPSRTTDRMGIGNEHWFVTVGGDGYETQVDPCDPMIVYSLWQYGGLVRHDRRSGETIDIKPTSPPGDPPLRWNWDSPFILSPHDHARLYFAANRLFRSDDRGQSWRVISPDLSRQLNRNELEILGRVWPADAVAKSESTSLYGNCVSLTESPLVAGLIYVGTDDGLVQITEDGGERWRRVETFPGVPERTYVSSLFASRHDADTVYVAFDHHKEGDFNPYLLVSADRGRTWRSIAGDLPDRNVVLAFNQDFVEPQLLFVGTEFGVYFSRDGGEHWLRLKGGIPTISVRDVDIQARESDLVVGTFGRGIYVLDDFGPLRTATREQLDAGPALCPVKPALRYVERTRIQGRDGRGSQGASFWSAPNPPFGAVFTYYLKEKLMTLKERRHEAETKARDEGRTPPYPTLDELRAEDQEITPQIVLLVRDDTGAIVRRLEASRDKGLHRVSWDLRYPASIPTELHEEEHEPWWEPPSGPLALPGTYTVTLAQNVDGKLTELTPAQSFEVVPLELATFATKDRAAVLAFQKKSARLQRAALGAVRAGDEAATRLQFLRQATLDTPAADPELLADIAATRARLEALLIQLRGDPTASKRQEGQPPSILERVDQMTGSWHTTSGPTQTQAEAYRFAGEQFAKVLADLRTLVQKDLARIDSRLEAAGAPWTPGRLPEWKAEAE